MIRSKRFQISVAVILGSFVLVGCRGGGGVFSGRRNSQAARKPAGPTLGRPSGLSSDYQQSQLPDHPESLAHHTARTSVVGTSRTNPQLTCPVSGDSLGSNGAPVTVTIKGEPIFVCSPACAKKAQRDPDRYLARVRAETGTR